MARRACASRNGNALKDPLPVPGCSKRSRCKAARRSPSEAYWRYAAASGKARQRSRWAFFSSPLITVPAQPARPEESLDRLVAHTVLLHGRQGLVIEPHLTELTPLGLFVHTAGAG